MGKLMKDKLIEHLQDAHALETNMIVMLQNNIAACADDGIRHVYEWHLDETRRHEKLLRERLEELDSAPSLRKEGPAIGGAFVKGLVDGVRSDKHGKMARDSYIAEQTEIAAYELLKRVARHAGDEKTMDLAENIRLEEVNMVVHLSEHLDRFVELSLEEQGLEVATLV